VDLRHASRDALAAYLSALEKRVHDLVAARRSSDTNPGDAFRGLYIADADVDRLFARRQEDDGPGWSPPLGAGDEARLSQVSRRLGLEGFDVAALVVALAPDFDRRFEQLYGYLQDDVTRRRAGIGLVLEICGADPRQVGFRERFLPAAVMVKEGLLLVEEPDRPFLTRPLRVPDAVCNFLAGSDRLDDRLAPFVVPAEPHPSLTAAKMERSLAAGTRLWYLREAPGSSARSIAACVLGEAAISLDLRGVAAEQAGEVVRVAVREAHLRDTPLIAGPVEAIAGCNGAIGSLADGRCTVALTGSVSWDPEWSPTAPLQLDVEPVEHSVRAAIWDRALGESAAEVDAAGATSHFKLSPEQIPPAASAALASAAAEGREVTVADLRRGARARAAVGLERLARRVEPEAAWDDLVLPDHTLAALRDIAVRVKQRERVLGEWSMRRGGGREEGVAALFAGQSGTGKTLAAEVIAGELGLHLYTVDLATVVDKYIGETEKNLERIFAEAEASSGVLFFDEADALFGKRSDVKDARDRYANIETAYLLQRMEAFRGIAILATNLRANLDDAFTRRLDKVVTFPMPGPAERAALWRRCLRPPLPVGDDVDLEFCAGSFQLSGGSIRNVALGAAYRAADAGAAVTMTDVVLATEDEYHKIGRLCRTEEFGPYFDLVAP
jgi:hypothetical protein